MEKKIRVFKSFEDQEQYHLDEMRKTTPLERLRRLYKLQKISRLLHPGTDPSGKIFIINGRTK